LIAEVLPFVNHQSIVHQSSILQSVLTFFGGD
jgi:hypothetical protein